MKINLSEIDQKQFDISERFIDGVGKVYLINPSYGKYAWTEDELHLRSVLLDENFNICCSGFGKFFNRHENKELDKLTEEAIQKGRSYFPAKMDGSLIIRSVINNKVCFRTRGSHTLGEFHERVMKLITEKYPKLLDVTELQGYSLLMEYTSPENKIVIDYNESQLTILGLMDLSASPPEFQGSPIMCRELAEKYGTPPLEFYQLSNDIEQVTQNIKTWKNSEGIVVWSEVNGKIHMTKIKAEDYIKIHYWKFGLNKNKIAQICWLKKIKSLAELEETFYKMGVDWEIISFVEKFYQEYSERKENVSKEIERYLNRINTTDFKIMETRKEKVFRIRELTDPNNKAFFNIAVKALLDGEDYEIYVEAIVQETSVNQLKNLDADSVMFKKYVDGVKDV